MKLRALFVSLVLLGIVVVGAGPASASTISFLEPTTGTGSIQVITDIVGATIVAGTESASLSVGTVTGTATLLFRRQMTNMGTMTDEGGGMGVSDVLELDTFLSPTGATIGFRATFTSDSETGISPPPGNFPAGVTNLLENGTPQLLTPPGFSVTLPGVGPVDLAVNAQSDATEGPEGVPEPSSLVSLSIALLGIGIIQRRRAAVASRSAGDRAMQ